MTMLQAVEAPLVPFLGREVSLQGSVSHNDEDFKTVVDDFVAGTTRKRLIKYV